MMLLFGSQKSDEFGVLLGRFEKFVTPPVPHRSRPHTGAPNSQTTGAIIRLGKQERNNSDEICRETRRNF